MSYVDDEDAEPGARSWNSVPSYGDFLPMRSPIALAIFAAVSAIVIGSLVWSIVHPLLVATVGALSVVP